MRAFRKREAFFVCVLKDQGYSTCGSSEKDL